MLCVCVVLMNGAAQSHAQQAIALRPSIADLTGAAPTAAEQDASRVGDDELPPPPPDSSASFSQTGPPQALELEPPPPPAAGSSTDPDLRGQDPVTIGDGSDAIDGSAPPRAGQRNPASRRPLPDPYEALGLRLGAFTFYPSLEISGLVTDNVLQDNQNSRSDLGLRLRPELAVQSDWVRHSYSFEAEADFVFYDRTPDADDLSADITSTLDLEARRSTDLQLQSTYQLSQSSGASSEVPTTATGNRTDHELGFATELTHRFGRLVAEFAAGASYLLFGDVKLSGGGTEDNSDRDYVEPFGGLKLTYQQSEAINPYAELRYEPRIHRRTVDRSGLRRDSHGIRAAIGLVVNDDPIWSGDIALAYDYRTYDDPGLADSHNVGIDASVTWRPTELTTVTWNATSELSESASPGISGIRSHSGILGIEHALRDNLVLSAQHDLSYNDRIGTNQDELIYNAELALSYLLNRNIAITTAYEFAIQETFKSSNDYTENRFTAGVRYSL